MIARVVRGILFLLVGAAAGYLAYMVGDRNPPVEIISAYATNSPVEPGTTLKIHYNLIRYKFCPYSSSRAIVDSSNTRHIIKDGGEDTPFGHLGQDNYSLPIRLPNDIVKGPARYYAITQYYCDLLQHLWPITVIHRPIEFLVK